jgi:hypothetical protein
MTLPPEAGSSAVAGNMPIPEMNTQPQPSGTQSRPISGAEASGTGDMPIREMNTQPQPSGTQSRPSSGMEAAGMGDMPIREMNAEPQQPTMAAVETAHEQEKLAAYLRDRQGRQASTGSAGAGEMPARDMKASG